MTWQTSVWIERCWVVLGRAFDNIEKNRLVLVSPWTDFNASIYLNTRFADDLITSLTSKQAKVVYKSILAPKKQKEMAEELGMTRQNFNYLWTSSRGQLILDYIAYFKTLIRKKFINYGTIRHTG